MIPGKFEYISPATTQEAVAQLKEDALPLAGGQSLVSMMKLRLAAPEKLIDLNGIAELQGVEVGSDNIVIGAMTSQQSIINDDALASACPILRETSLQIADPQVRSRGTIGGNAANGDPGNDMPALMQLLDASYELESAGGNRSVKARDYYEGAYFTVKKDDELLTKITIPLPAAGHGCAYIKQKRKVGDYATAAVGVVLTNSGGKLANVAIALTNVGDTPLLAAEAAAALEGSDGGDDAQKDAAAKAVAITNPVSDGRGPAEFRKHLVETLCCEAIRQAMANAK